MISRFAFDTAPKLGMGINQQVDPISQNGFFYVTTRHVLQAIKATGWKKGDSTHKVALNLLGRAGSRPNWFETGFDWALAFALPVMVEKSKIGGKARNVRWPMKIK